MRKIIKKILNLFGWLAFAISLAVIILSIILNTPKIQDTISRRIISKLEQRLGNKITFSKIKIHVFNRIDFENLLITDLDTDTIIYAGKLQAGFPGLLQKIVFNKELPVRIGSLSFDESYFRLYTNHQGVLNIQFILDSLNAKKDTSGISKPTYIDKIMVKNSRFAFLRADSSGKDFGVDFSRMIFNKLNFNVKDIVLNADTINLDIKGLSFIERSGLEIREFSSALNLCTSHLHLDKADFQTQKSSFSFNTIYFDFTNFKDFGINNLYEKVHLNIECIKSTLFLDDIGYFARLFQGMDNTVDLSGRITGTLSNVRGTQLILSYGTGTRLMGKFDMNGLPEIPLTFLIFDVKELITTTEDINSFKLPNNKYIDLPDKFSAIKKYYFKGNFTGFFKDFVTYGELKTDLGILKTDLLFKPDSANRVSFSGRLSSDHFNIGALTNSPERIGNISLDMSIDGLGRIDKGFDVDIDGDISQFEINNYNYKNIKVNGVFSQKRFNGSLTIDDSNLRLDFNGLVDLSSKVRQYKFQANVLFANLYALNFNKSDPNYNCSFLINADLFGNTLDEINGNVKLLNSLFSKTDAQIQAYDLDLTVSNDSVLNRLELKSDFLDARFSGKYKLSKLADEYKTLFYDYFPALSREKNSAEMLTGCDFTYTLNFKNSLPVFVFFLPNYKVYPNTLITGNLKRGLENNSSIHIQSPQFRAKNNAVEQLVVNSNTIEGNIKIEFGCKKLNIGNRIQLENFTAASTIDSNFVDFSSHWLNWDSSLYKGKLDGNIAFLNKPGQKLQLAVNIDSSMIVINDSVWTLKAFNIKVDSNKFSINDFEIRHNEEYMAANGSLSDDNYDSLTCRFNSFNFGNLNFFTRSTVFKFGGILNGDAKITGFKKPLYFASVFVKKLELNNELVGDTYINSKWEDKLKAVSIKAKAMRGNLNTLSIDGNFYPKTNKLDFELDLNKFKLDFINPYLKMAFSSIRGNATGLLTLKGTLLEPNLNGTLNLQKAAFTVDYLKTRYNFTSNINISNDNIIFDNILVNDEFGNTANLNGVVRTEYFRTYFLNFTISTNRFLCLNTKQGDNPMFFGTAYASGLIRINGEATSLKFDVSARSEKGTVFNIPITGSEELTEYNFIKIVGSDTIKTIKIKDDYKVNLAGMQMDFNLKLTPDATMRIIFDPTIGDIISGVGNGDIRMSINTLGDFQMVGEYIIESGDYLFTLKNVINKKFKVEQGSTLRWSGDPINADVNIDTYYRTKASLAELYPSDNSGAGTGTGSNTGGTAKKTVDCKLGLTGKLMQPDINYDIELPFSEQDAKDILASTITTEEDRGKQFLSLLILNRFMPYGGSVNKIGGEGNDFANVSWSEPLSNQLSNWLSQISNDVDIGVNITPGSTLSTGTLTSGDVELALSTQLLNDRLSINGSVDYKTNAEVAQTSALVGDVDVDYKITKNGRLRSRFFNRSNDDKDINSMNGSTYTQGMGVFYTEEFDKIGEVTSRYWNALRGKNKKDKDKLKGANSDAIKNEEEDAN